MLNQVLQGAPGQLLGKGGVPKSLTVVAVPRPARVHAIDHLSAGQPVLAFQWIEGGWLLALSVLLIAVTVWLVRRRAV